MARVEGWPSVFAAMDAFGPRSDNACFDTLEEVADEIQTDIRQSISVPYPPASRSGEPPHLRTGSLHGGVETQGTIGGHYIEYKVTSRRSTGLGPREVPGWLEHGHGKLEPRPYMQPALARAAASFVNDVRTRLRVKLGLRT